MARVAASYRAARRNVTRDAGLLPKWRAGTKCKVLAATPVTPNKRDRSKTAEERRADTIPTIEFTGWTGLLRSLVSHSAPTIFQKKPKRGWAAKCRRRPFKNYLDDDALLEARMQHPWWRRHFARQETCS